MPLLCAGCLTIGLIRLFLSITIQRIRTPYKANRKNLDRSAPSSNMFSAYTIGHFICPFLKHLHLVILKLRVTSVNVKLSEDL